MIRVIGFSLYGEQAASRRYRLGQYMPGLRGHGVDLQVEGLLDDDYLQKTFKGETFGKADLLKAYGRRLSRLPKLREYDLAIIQGELFPLAPGEIESRLLPIPYIYDFDDAFFLKYRMPRFRKFSFLPLKNKFDIVVAKAAAVTAGNRHLVDYARRWNPNTHFFPTVVSTDRYVCAPTKSCDCFTVGWIGSPSTGHYLSALYRPLSSLGNEGRVRFVVVGAHCPPIDNVEVVNLPWSEKTEIDILNTFDVGVMPLPDDEWARGKCAFKLIQYMACGVASVAAPVGANVDVAEGSCALLASDETQWIECLRRLRDDPGLRQTLGAAGRRRVEQTYSLQVTLSVIARVIHDVAAKARR
jgi:glycosyltransferase involved in cell wall biosynthesis